MIWNSPLRVQLEALLPAGEQVAQKHLSPPDQAMNQFDPRVGIQCYSHRAFAAVIHVELKIVGGQRGIIHFRRPAHVAHRVPGQGFDLDHVGAQISKDGAGGRRGHPVVDFHDGDVVERCGHGGQV